MLNSEFVIILHDYRLTKFVAEYCLGLLVWYHLCDMLNKVDGLHYYYMKEGN